MDYDLGIRDSAPFAFICLGAPVHRLDPGIVSFRKATDCQVHVSAGEFNVAANRSNWFGLRSAIVTAVVKYEIGDMVAERLRAMGVTPFYRAFEHNGVTGPRYFHNLQRPRLWGTWARGFLQPRRRSCCPARAWR